MSALLERLRSALAAEFDVERVVAGGGMGLVFEARQRRLDRRVAIKILRPELATAVAAERFLSEGRILARLSHPNIVQIFAAGEADGLLYYVMEFVAGQSLADRLKQGPLPPARAVRLGRDLLAALGTAHEQGIVHRDVKPANIFLRGEQTLLGDFGIARWRQEHDAGLTTPGQLIGTPRYMSPEQRDGVPVTMESDVYAAGLVLWEACTGERWPAYQPPERGDWRKIPATLTPALRGALAIEPGARWRNAVEMSRAIAEARPRRRWPWLAGTAAAGVLAAALLWPARPSATELVLEIASMETSGSPGRTGFADSVVRELVSSLRGYADLSVRDARGRRATAGAVQLAGTAIFRGDSLRLELLPSGSGRAGETAKASGLFTPTWPGLVRTLADSMLGLVWRGRIAGDKFLPLRALPQTGPGLQLYRHAERLYAEGAWDSAEAAYIAAEREDSACLLCSYRLLDIGRWLSTGQEPVRLARVTRYLDSFPDHYRALIVAQREPWPARYDSLSAAAARWPEFSLASFILGDEIFHRGPLHGLRRHEALQWLRKAVDQKPDFAPAWEHLAWVLLSERDSAPEVRAALDRVPFKQAGAGLSMVLRLMLELGFQWRFFPPEIAAAMSRQALSMPEVERDSHTPAGGRLMMTVDAPRGAVGLGSLLELWRARPHAVRSGLVAQAHGWAALGRLDSLRAVATRLRREGYPALALYALELEGALGVFDPEESAPPAPSLTGELQAYLERGTAPELRHRASGMLALLAHRRGDSAAGVRFRAELDDEPAPYELRNQVEAFGALVHGDTAVARARLGALPPSNLPRMSTRPLADAVSRLLRSIHAEQDSGSRVAANQLRWHEHLVLEGFPTDDPQPGEVAWALSTLIRSRRMILLEHLGQADAELCSAYAAVARLWQDAPLPYAARAGYARRRFGEARCTELR